MNLTEAWDLLRAKAVHRADTDFFPAAPFIDAFEQAPDDCARDRLRQAMWTVLSDGTVEDQAIAATFFAKTQLPTSLGDAAAKLYTARGLDGTSPIAALLAGQRLSSAAANAVRAAFRTDPVKHSRFAYSTVVDASDPQDWAALKALASKTDDPAVLANVFNAALAKDRVSDLGAVLSQRPEALLRSAASQTLETDFLAAAGINQ